MSGVNDSFSKLDSGVAGVPLLGDMLVEQGLLKRKVFEDAMQAYRPQSHGRVGDYLVDQGILMREVIERVVEQQRLMHAELARVELLE